MTADLQRRHQVEQLLRTLLDYLPTPNRDSTAPRSASEPGPAPGRRARCQRCDSTGRVRGDQPCQACRTLKAGADQAGDRWTAYGIDHGCTLCLACDGAGYVLARRGDQPVDEMLTQGRTDQHDAAAERAERRRSADAALTRLQRLAAIREHGEPEDWWLAAADRERVRQWRTTSHGEVWNLLQTMQVSVPFRYSIVMRYVVYADDLSWEVSDRMRERLDETFDWMAERLPERIKMPDVDHEREKAARRSLEHGRSPRHVEARAARDERIRAAVLHDGLSLREAASRFGVSHETVRQAVSATPSAVVASGPAA